MSVSRVISAVLFLGVVVVASFLAPGLYRLYLGRRHAQRVAELPLHARNQISPPANSVLNTVQRSDGYLIVDLGNVRLLAPGFEGSNSVWTDVPVEGTGDGGSLTFSADYAYSYVDGEGSGQFLGVPFLVSKAVLDIFGKHIDLHGPPVILVVTGNGELLYHGRIAAARSGLGKSS